MSFLFHYYLIIFSQFRLQRQQPSFPIKPKAKLHSLLYIVGTSGIFCISILVRNSIIHWQLWQIFLSTWPFEIRMLVGVMKRSRHTMSIQRRVSLKHRKKKNMWTFQTTFALRNNSKFLATALPLNIGPRVIGRGNITANIHNWKTFTQMFTIK